MNGSSHGDSTLKASAHVSQYYRGGDAGVVRTWQDSAFDTLTVLRRLDENILDVLYIC